MIIIIIIIIIIIKIVIIIIIIKIVIIIIIIISSSSSSSDLLSSSTIIAFIALIITTPPSASSKMYTNKTQDTGHRTLQFSGLSAYNSKTFKNHKYTWCASAKHLWFAWSDSLCWSWFACWSFANHFEPELGKGKGIHLLAQKHARDHKFTQMYIRICTFYVYNVRLQLITNDTNHMDSIG